MGRGAAGVLRDPLVPLDFGEWFRRVFGVFGRNFRRLALLALIPAGLFAVGLLAMVAALPSPEGMQRRIDEATRAAGGRPSLMEGFWVVFGQLVPVALAVTVVLLVVGALFLGSAFFVAIREANGQSTMSARALSFARPRVLPLIGWSLLTGIVMTVVLAVPLAPGVLSGVGWLAAVGSFVDIALMLSVMVVFAASLVGVVVVERGGAKRAAGLIRGRFWLTCGRLAVALLIYAGYATLVNLVTLPLAASSSEDGSVTVGVVLGAIAQGVLMIPAMVFAVAVCLVSYAELRYREDRATTSSLAAQLTS